MNLHEYKTVYYWKEAYKSPVERVVVFCPNCGLEMRRDDFQLDDIKNGSGMYLCPRCAQITTMWFQDVKYVEKDEIFLHKFDWRSVMLMAGAIMGLMTLTIYLTRFT